jgi:maleate isomerase
MPRLGLIVPSSNTTMEPEFSQALQGTNISLHTTRSPLNSVTIKGLEAMEKETKAAAKLLKDADVDLVVFGCTSGSLFRGLGYDLVLAKQIAEAAGCRVVTTAGAVVDALKALKAHRLSLATPYIAEVNAREIDFLTKSGFEILKTESLGIKENLQIGRLTPPKTRQFLPKKQIPLKPTPYSSVAPTSEPSKQYHYWKSNLQNQWSAATQQPFGQHSKSWRQKSKQVWANYSALMSKLRFFQVLKGKRG